MNRVRFTFYSFLALALLCGAAIAEFRIAKDRTPGGLYVVGPDLSPDSVFGEYLYYSPDAGTTLVKKDSADYGFIEPEYSSIAADFTSGNLYKICNLNLYHSDNYGTSWNMRYFYIGSHDEISSGRLPGEIYIEDVCILRSLDYGINYDTLITSFIFHVPIAGYTLNELYGFRYDTGDIFFSLDTGHTNYPVSNIGPDLYLRKTRIRRGHQGGEVYLLSADSLMRSTDHCSTFTRTNPLSLSFDDISPGNNPGELYASRSVWFYDPESGFRGGRVEICFSEDYGRNFSCLRQTASGITFFNLSGIDEVEKPESYEIKAYPNPFNSAVTIAIETPSLSPPHAGEMPQAEGVRVEIFDLSGRRVETLRPSADPLLKRVSADGLTPLTKGGQGGSFTWQPSASLPSGVYLVRAKTDAGAMVTKRVVLLK